MTLLKRNSKTGSADYAASGISTGSSNSSSSSSSSPSSSSSSSSSVAPLTIDSSLSASDQAALRNAYIAGGGNAGNVSYSSATPTQQTQPVQTTQPTVQATQSPTTQTTQTTQQTGAQPQTQTQQTTQTNPLTIPTNGSVVDLLNSVGADSSFAARSQLAQQYGIQGYTGTAAQNTQLAQKYTEAYNALKGTSVPQNAADARSTIQTYQDEASKTGSIVDPSKQFMDMYSSMNPIEASIFKQLSDLASTVGDKESISELYAKEYKKEGIEALDLELADINRIMDGTEDDIRSEIENSSGFATESQVQALVGARNKVLLRKATYLQDAIKAKNDYVDRIVSLTQADREQVSKDLNMKLGITQQLLTMTQRMEDSAKDNYKSIVSTIGWDGLAKSMNGNSTQIRQVEKMFGLPDGGLNQLAIQEKLYKAENDIDTTIVDVGGQKKLINSKTGATIQVLGSSGTGSSGKSSSSSGGGVTFTSTQTNKGAAAAGMSVADFKALPADVQNVFVNNTSDAGLIVDDISAVGDGSMSRDEAVADIDSMGISQTAKDYFKGLLPAALVNSSGGGFWSGVAHFFGF